MKKANIISLVTLSALSSLFSTAALAVEDAGRVMFVAGKATIVNVAGQERIAKKGDFLRQGDRLVTSDRGMIQVKMRDDGIMAVRPGTDLKLNDMVPRLNKSDGPSQALLLSRGGVRVLTGNERNKLGYVIKTAATSLRLREGDTEALVIPKLTPAADRVADLAPPGIYNRVNAGVGTVEGAAGKSISLTANQISFTTGVNAAPVLVASLPSSYISTTVPVQITSVAKPSAVTAVPPPSAVPGGIVIAPTVIAPTAATPIAQPGVAGTVAIAPVPATTTVIGTATPVPVNLAPLPVALAPIAVTMPPPPVMIAPPTLISSPILVAQPVVLPPPPPPVTTTVTLAPTTTNQTITTTPILTTTTGTIKGTYCIRGTTC